MEIEYLLTEEQGAMKKDQFVSGFTIGTKKKG